MVVSCASFCVDPPFRGQFAVWSALCSSCEADRCSGGVRACERETENRQLLSATRNQMLTRCAASLL
jgi:hypothetical protein